MSRVIAALLLLLPFMSSPAAADGACAGLQLDKVVSPHAALHDVLTLHVEGLAHLPAGCDPAKFTLRLAGQAMAGLAPTYDTTAGTISFFLDRKDGDSARWLPILGSPTGLTKVVTVGVEPDGSADLPHPGDTVPMVPFEIFGYWGALFAGLMTLAMAVGLVCVAHFTPALRDSLPAGGDFRRRPFSLGRCQMAFWFVLLTTAFLALWLITGNYNGILTSQSLVLLGISGATGLSAFSIDTSKANTPVPAGAPDPPAPPQHTNLLDDILTDKNGIALQRLQVFIWTWMLGLISVVSIYRNLSLPAFDDTLLTMSGISSGLYVGFKFPEKQS